MIATILTALVALLLVSCSADGSEKEEAPPEPRPADRPIRFQPVVDDGFAAEFPSQEPIFRASGARIHITRPEVVDFNDQIKDTTVYETEIYPPNSKQTLPDTYSVQIFSTYDGKQEIAEEREMRGGQWGRLAGRRALIRKGSDFYEAYAAHEDHIYCLCVRIASGDHELLDRFRRSFRFYPTY